jgi:hypothetical protein
VPQKGKAVALAWTSSTTSPKIHQAVTSSTAADVIVTVPTGVSIILLSVRILASTGKVVMLIETLMERAKLVKGTLAAESLGYRKRIRGSS